MCFQLVLILVVVLASGLPSNASSWNSDCEGEGPGWFDGKHCQGHSHGDLYPDLFDCGSFYSCVWGVARAFKCPADLHFNDSIKRCDNPWNAGCKEECPLSTTTAAPTTTITTTTRATTTPSTPKPHCDIHQFMIGFARINWRAAEAECKRYAKVLVTIQSEAKYQCVLEVISKFGANHPPESNYWIGGNDLATKDGRFVWAHGGGPVNTFFPTGNPQPDNSTENSNCVNMRKVFPEYAEETHVMNDDDCELKSDYVCEYR